VSDPASSPALDHARIARASGIVACVGPGEGAGLADLGVLVAEGADAARFLHSQVTSDVEGLAEGGGSLSARVARTGHLAHVFSLHRLGATTFWMVLPEPEVAALRDDLDAFLFTDDVTLTPAPPRPWLHVQGPAAPAALEAVFGPLGFEPWASLPEGATRRVTRARAELSGAELPGGLRVLRRSLGGDAGFLLCAEGDLSPLVPALTAAALTALSPAAWSAALEGLRVEAGLPRIGPETAGKRRLLPETGIEQLAVSYTKGCYLGQEVIARVRTYGSVPTLLRGLRWPAEAPVPAPGTRLATPEGRSVGHAASAGPSAVLGGTLLLAYLDRAHRTPGTHLTVVPEGGEPVTAEVVALPVHRAPDTASRVQQLYDRAVRVFAEGREAEATSMLEEALRLDPTHADSYEAIGVMLGRAGRFHEAIDVFRRLEEVAPDEPMVNTNLSIYYMKLGDTQTAEDEAAKGTLKQMQKGRGRTATEVDVDLERGKQKDAERKLTMFRRVLLIDEADEVALFGAGSALLTLGRPAEALESLSRALEVAPNNAATYVLHGRALEQLDRPDDAVSTYRKGLEVASRKGDLMPLREMEHRLLLLGASRRVADTP
jgi:folate-binding protein YgfZ